MNSPLDCRLMLLPMNPSPLRWPSAPQVHRLAKVYNMRRGFCSTLLTGLEALNCEGLDVHVRAVALVGRARRGIMSKTYRKAENG